MVKLMLLDLANEVIPCFTKLDSKGDAMIVFNSEKQGVNVTQPSCEIDIFANEYNCNKFYWIPKGAADDILIPFKESKVILAFYGLEESSINHSDNTDNSGDNT